LSDSVPQENFACSPAGRIAPDDNDLTAFGYRYARTIGWKISERIYGYLIPVSPRHGGSAHLSDAVRNLPDTPVELFDFYRKPGSVDGDARSDDARKQRRAVFLTLNVSKADRNRAIVAVEK
jgi:hypothetical protein